MSSTSSKCFWYSTIATGASIGTLLAVAAAKKKCPFSLLSSLCPKQLQCAGKRSTSTLSKLNTSQCWLYSVQLQIQKSAQPQFEDWISNHMSELLKTNTDGWVSAEAFRVSPSANTPHCIFVLGGPGAGKGTQCDLIVSEFGYVHISAGDCLRAERNRKSKDADLINKYIEEGKIVPVEITVKLVKNAMEASGGDKFLIDGFPRNLENVNGWDKVMGDSVHVACVLFLDCPEAVMQSRLMERGKTSGRVDDNLKSIKKRFNTYEKETRPIVDFFSDKGKVRHVIADRTVEEVWKEVKSVITNVVNTECNNTSSDSVVSYDVQYRAKSKAVIDAYLKNDAPALQQAGKDLFGDKIVSASRSTFSRIHSL